jgi:hypothetical protein
LTFRHLLRSGALEAAARDVGSRLQRSNSRITACHIELEGNADAPGEGGPHKVKIHLSVPGAQIHAEGTQQHGEGHGLARNALHTAYDNAKRQLENLKRLHIRPDFAGS